MDIFLFSFSIYILKFCLCYLILAEGHVEERHPGCVVLLEQLALVVSLHDEVKGLREAEEEDDIDDREGEHVSSDH